MAERDVERIEDELRAWVEEPSDRSRKSALDSERRDIAAATVRWLEIRAQQPESKRKSFAAFYDEILVDRLGCELVIETIKVWARKRHGELWKRAGFR